MAVKKAGAALQPVKALKDGMRVPHPHIQMYYAVHAGPISDHAQVLTPGNGTIPVPVPGGGGPPHKIETSFDILDGQYAVTVTISAKGR